MRHIQKHNRRFVWRLNFFDEVLKDTNEEGVEATYSHPNLAAYEADKIKYYLREKYNFRTTKTEPSFPEETFRQRAEQANLDLSDLPAVLSSLPYSAREFLLNGYADLFAAHAARLASRPPPSTDYLATLLAALSARLTDGQKILHKSRQLNALNDAQRAALQALEYRVEAFEVATREETTRILSLV